MSYLLGAQSPVGFPANYSLLIFGAALSMMLSLAAIALIREPTGRVSSDKISWTSYFPRLWKILRGDLSFVRLMSTRLLIGFSTMAFFFNVTAATEKFQKLINKYPDSNLADNAQYWIGECFYALGKYEDAVVEFDKVARNYRKSNKIPDAMLKQAFSFCKLKEIYACKQILLDLIKKYPDSEAASKAKVELNKLK